MQLCEEEDDATSPLAAPKPEPNDQSFQVGETVVFNEVGLLLFLFHRFFRRIYRFIDGNGILKEEKVLSHMHYLLVHGFPSTRSIAIQATCTVNFSYTVSFSVQVQLRYNS